MAELPDLTVFAKALNRLFAGKTLKEIDLKFAKKLNVSASALTSALRGHKLVEVLRSGKTFQLHFENSAVLGIHLMLRGNLVLLEKKDMDPKYLIISFQFSNGLGFAVVDPLRQATPTLNPLPFKAPDAMDISLEAFTKLLSSRKKMVKEVLMDQKAIRGIGNTYADEILWEARISPFSVSKLIPVQQVKALFKAMHLVLEKAVLDISKASGDGFIGEYREKMRVHGKGIDKSPTGAVVQHEKISGRLSYYTSEQKLYDA
jgi:formamidopyrimidine-DNA glycosylase